jgi:hypothetical protein
LGGAVVVNETEGVGVRFWDGIYGHAIHARQEVRADAGGVSVVVEFVLKLVVEEALASRVDWDGR